MYILSTDSVATRPKAINVNKIINPKEINCFCISSLLFCLLNDSESFVSRFVLSVIDYPTFPIKYTTVKINTHTTSMKCQYKLNVLNLGALYKLRPLFAFRINNPINQQIPKSTCPPWNPTIA